MNTSNRTLIAQLIMFDFVFEFLANLLNSKKLQNESNVRYFYQIHQNNLDILKDANYHY